MTSVSMPPTTLTPQSHLATITPDMARELLRRNTRNRKLREDHIANLARDMTGTRVVNGQTIKMWALNGDAIRISVDNVILDGQHRLHACLRAEIPFETFIVTGLPPEAQETIDTGRRRTMGDALTLRGEGNAATLAALLRTVWLWDNGDRRFSGNQSPTFAEMADMLTRYPDLRRSAEIAQRTYRTFRYLPPSAVGTAHHLCSRIAPEDAVWFFQRVADGAELPTGHPVLALRQRAMNIREKKSRTSTAQHLAYIIRAWNAHRQGRTLTVIYHPADAETPEPK